MFVIHENFRQGDDPILNILNEIRTGEVGDESREQLRSRYISNIERTEQDLDHESTRLYTHNIDVDKINEIELNKVQANEFVYEMSTRGKKPLVEMLKNLVLPLNFLVRLRKGARVMCVKNNFEKGYVNGTLGVVVSCAPDSDPVIRSAPTPDFPKVNC